MSIIAQVMLSFGDKDVKEELREAEN